MLTLADIWPEHFPCGMCGGDNLSQRTWAMAQRWILDVVNRCFWSCWVPLMKSCYPLSVLECTAAALWVKWSPEVEPVSKLQLFARLIQCVLSLLCHQVTLCVPLLSRTLAHSQKQLQFLHTARCRLWFLSLVYCCYLTPDLSFSSCQ